MSYYFPPIKAIGSVRSYNFVKYLAQKEWDVSVFTTNKFKYFANDNYLKKLKNVKYCLIPSYDLQFIKKLLIKNKQVKEVGKNGQFNKIEKNTFFQKLRHSFPFNIMYEGGFIYTIFAVLYGLYYIKKNNIKYVYSTYSPYSNNLIGYFIKLFYKDCYWVVDFRDLPVGDNDTNIFFKSIQKNLNKMIYNKADAITTVSNGMKEHIKQFNDNIHVITNGFDIDILNTKEKITNENNNFNILYTGSLYKGKRDASLFFNAIKILLDKKKLPENLKLVYAGNDGYLWKQCALEYDLQNYIEIKGLLRTSEVIKLQERASINLLLTWSTQNEKGILTGKLFEYLSVKKPIICSVSGLKDDEIDDLFLTLNCGSVFYEGELDLMAKVIENIYMNKNSYDYNLDELEKYTSKYLTNKLEKILLEKDKA